MPTPLLITTAAVVIATLNALKRRRAYARRQPPAAVPEINPGLPPLARGEALEVMLDAEKAAIRQALGGEPSANPHSEGTRAYIIWASHHGATLLDWEH